MITHSIPSQFVSLGKAARAVGLSQVSLRKLLDRPECAGFCWRSMGAHRRVNLAGLRTHLKLDPPSTNTYPRVCLLARVSSPSQAKPRTDEPDAKSDLERQVEVARAYVRDRWGSQCLLTENIRVGSGLNFNHPKIIEFTLNLVQGKYDYVVFTYKDRVARSSYDLFQNISKSVGTELIMIEDKDNPTFAESLVDDIIALTCVASAKHNGEKFGARVRVNVDKDVLIDLYMEYSTGITFEQLVEYAKRNNLRGLKGETLQKQKIITLFKKNRRVLEMAVKERSARESTLEAYNKTHKTKFEYVDYAKWCEENGLVAMTETKVRVVLRTM